MKRRRLVVSDAAAADIVEQAEWYATQSGQALARKWEKAITATVFRIVGRPASGARCRFRSAELAGVRWIKILSFPSHLLFYRFDEGNVEILRVVHGARDLERLL